MTSMSEEEKMPRAGKIQWLTDGVAPMPDLDFEFLEKWLGRVGEEHNRILGELSYLFCCDEKILEVNREFLQHDYYTDIITFDYDEENQVNGDIVISLDTVKSNAELFNKPYEEELYRVIIHGILHLCGINDKGPGEREIMEEAENKALALWFGR